MSINLSKGQVVNLTALNRVMVNISWDSIKHTNKFASTSEIAADAWAIATNGYEQHLVYYGETEWDTKIVHVDGEGTGSTEQIIICFNKLPDDIKRIIIGVTIYQGAKRYLSLASLDHVSIRVHNMENNEELLHYTSNDFQYDEYKDYHTIVPVIFIHKDGGWRFKAIDKPIATDGITEASKIAAASNFVR